ncbi:hypothetical protein [Marinobacter caseinilyticus]|uniref:hypothetical protein n=1 Tax=Marinobacter caseinilyticus TaxID=2692195 RepID=UPI001F25F34F|nr:hypothetical protein [Marinobacter caseinilyticus]
MPMRSLLSPTTLLITACLAGTAAKAENLDVLMSDLFPQRQPAYIGYDSVERTIIPKSSTADRKYLIVDFRFDDAPESTRLQASVHTICMTLLRDRELIQSLSDSGYDMVSVAFDRQSQYDCL